MHTANATATARSTSATPFETAPPLPRNRFSEAKTRSSPTVKAFEVPFDQVRSGSTPPIDPDAPIPPPVYSGTNSTAEGLKQCSIFDQSSLERKWSSIQSQLRNQPVSEKEFIQILRSGILQTDTGKSLVPLLVPAVMDWIIPAAGLSREDFAETICCLPPEKWAGSLGENFNFPHDTKGKSVHGFIQTQLELTRSQRNQKIADGELLDNDTWKALRTFTKEAVSSLHEGKLKVLSEAFEEFNEARPSTQQVKMLMAKFVSEFVKEIEEPTPGMRHVWSESFPGAVHKLHKRLMAIEIIDNQPQRSWLENTVELGKLGVNIANSGLLAARDMFFGVESEPGSEVAPRQSRLLLDMQEVETKSRFHHDVGTTPLSHDGSLAQALVYTLNAVNGLGGDTALRAGLSYALNRVADPVMPTAPSDIIPTDVQPVSIPPLPATSEKAAAEVNDFFASSNLQTASRSDDRNPVETDSASSPTPDVSPASPSAAPEMGTLEQLTQTVRDLLATIKDPLVFPSAAAADSVITLSEEQSAMLSSLGQQAVYGRTVESVPSLWEKLGPYLYEALSRVSEFITSNAPLAGAAATQFATHALGAGAAATQLARDNPGTSVTAAFMAASAVYNQYCQLFPDHSPGEITLDIESPALHQELLEDEVERILEAPVANGQPSLSDAILELMYESPEQNLLNDDQLINQVALLLQQPSSQAPEKTYFELIHDAQIATHDHEAPVQADSPSGSKRVKRDAETVLVSADLQGDDVEPTLDLEENDSTQVARLTEYLQKMEEPKNPDIDAYEAVDNSPADSPIDAATQVIGLLRRKRNVTWMDSSRAAGDRELIPRYTEALLRSVEEPTLAPHVSVPSHSSFGRCWSNVVGAFQNPFFLEWVTQVGLDVSTVRVNPMDGTLTGVAKGTAYGCSLTDHSGWADVAGPILRAIKVVNPKNERMFSPLSSQAPLSLIRDFHGETQPPTVTDARLRISELNAAQAFSPVNADDPRSEVSSKRMKQQLGDLYTHSYLVGSLAALIKDKTDWTILDLNDCSMPVHPDSSFANEYPAEARRAISVRRFISDIPWKLPTTVAEVRNLIEVVTFNLPAGPENGNFRGALNNPVPPSPAQRQLISETASQLKPGLVGSLYDHLWLGLPVNDPAHVLNQLLNSESADRWGRALGAKLGAITTPSSEKEWVMTALLLELDATPGEPRNHVGGYNLTQEANWGTKPSTVVTRLANHLAASGKVTSRMAPVAAHHLLLANAPEFLVRSMPDNLVCGSHTWATLRMAAARIEQISPGTVPEMTFAQVMAYGATEPINVGEEIAAQMLSVDPLIDWAISQGVIQQSPTDIYSKEQLEIAREKFQTNTDQLAKAQEYLTASMPSRTEIARAELIRVFGKDYPFEEKVLLKADRPGSETEIYYSMLDLYITGKLTSFEYYSTSDDLPFAQFRSRLSLLKPVGPIFEKQFTDYFTNARTGSKTAIMELFSNLPSEDRKILQYGKQRYFTLRSAATVPLNQQTEEIIKPLVAHKGILVQAKLGQKICYYEIFPSAGQIRKRTDLPNNLPLDGKIQNVHATNNPRIVKAQVATSQNFDWSAYKDGTPPQSGVSSAVIIEELIPKEKRVWFKPGSFDVTTVANMHASDTNVRFMASTLVEEHFMPGREELYSLARGITDTEQIAETDRVINEFLLGLVPFKSCIENAMQGNVRGAVLDCELDVLGFVIPGVGATGKIAKVVKSGANFIPKALKTTWIASSTLVSSANPFDGLGKLARTAINSVCQLGVDAYRAARIGIGQSRKLFGISKAINSADLSKRADITSGTFKAAASGSQAAPITALFKDGKWYAFDTTRSRPYGPPLENFMPDSSIPLQRTTFSDGTNPLTPSRLFDTESHVIQRTTGVDVVVGDKVYRFDPKHPEALNDIASPAYFKDLEGFEAICSGGRSKRATSNCFSKMISSVRSVAGKRAQALEHKRLYPRPAEQGVDPRVVHERRIYKCNYDYTDCRPEELTVPLQFKATTTGSIIKNDHFGFAGTYIDNDVNAATRVVKINDIIHGLSDAREVRAFFVRGQNTYLVAEVDTGLFYFCKYDGRTTNNVVFTRISHSDTGLGKALITDYHQLKDPFIEAAAKLLPNGQLLPKNDFILLPTIDSLYRDLEATNRLSPADLADFKRKMLRLTDEQKRDLVVTALKNNIGNFNVEIVIPAIKIETMPKPPAFNMLAQASKNRLYADYAKEQVLKQVEATGLGPFNQRNSGDPIDVQRVELTQPVVLWEYSRWGKPDTVEVLLKTGAGNCDHMAKVSMEIIQRNGGAARVWHMNGHAFTMVGGPSGPTPVTRHFTEPEFDNAYITDSWAGISCRARDYTTQLKAQMATWANEGKMIITTDNSVTPPNTGWADPTGPLWTAAINGLKTA